MRLHVLLIGLLLVISAVMAYTGYGEQDTFKMLLALWLIGAALLVPHIIPDRAL